MGYAFDVMTSIPIAIILYVLSEKIVRTNITDNRYEKMVQKNFVIMFIIGMVFILLASTLFDEKKKRYGIYNRPLQYALYLSGMMALGSSVVVNWDTLDENTKIIILMISLGGCVTMSFKWAG